MEPHVRSFCPFILTAPTLVPGFFFTVRRIDYHCKLFFYQKKGVEVICLCFITTLPPKRKKKEMLPPHCNFMNNSLEDLHPRLLCQNKKNDRIGSTYYNVEMITHLQISEPQMEKCSCSLMDCMIFGLSQMVLMILKAVIALFFHLGHILQ